MEARSPRGHVKLTMDPSTRAALTAWFEGATKIISVWQEQLGKAYLEAMAEALEEAGPLFDSDEFKAAAKEQEKIERPLRQLFKSLGIPFPETVDKWVRTAQALGVSQEHIDNSTMGDLFELIELRGIIERQRLPRTSLRAGRKPLGREPKRRKVSPRPITKRQQEVLDLMIEHGHDVMQVALVLGVSRQAVGKIYKSATRKLQAADIVTNVKKPAPMDPAILDAGKNREGRTKRQRNKFDEH